LLLLLVCSLAVTGCGGTERSAFEPPRDHGGFSGANAKAFDATYVRCYRATARAVSQGKARNVIALTSYVGQEHAVDEGCSAGVRAATMSAPVMGNGVVGPHYVMSSPGR
jgi:hypothetical protein